MNRPVTRPLPKEIDSEGARVHLSCCGYLYKATQTRSPAPQLPQRSAMKGGETMKRIKRVAARLGLTNIIVVIIATDELKIAQVTQNHLQDLESHLSKTCVEYLRYCLPAPEPGNDSNLSNRSSDQVIISYFANFSLAPQAKQKIGSLSGGQKARLTLATQVWCRLI